MSAETIDLDLLLAAGAHSLLERTLIAEYLLIKGFLMSDLEKLPVQAAKSLRGGALQFAALRVLEFEFTDRFHGRFRLPFSLN